MTLIKCPHCSHSVLSVASHCPACSGDLGQAFLGPEHEGELAECRACGHPVRTRTRACPHCGIPHPAKRRGAPREVLLVVAMVILASVALAALPRLLVRAPKPAPRAGGTPAPPKPATLRPMAVERPVAAPKESVTAPSETVARPTLLTRWTTMWVNVRAGPSNDAPVLRVLRPGTPVKGTEGRWGWWAIRLSSDSVGYVAGELLRAQPDSMPGLGS